MSDVGTTMDDVAVGCVAWDDTSSCESSPVSDMSFDGEVREKEIGEKVRGQG